MIEKEISKVSVSIILHLPKNPPYEIENLYKMIETILNQYNMSSNIILLDECNDKKILSKISEMNINSYQILPINEKYDSLAAWLNSAIEKTKSDYLLYIEHLVQIILVL